MLASRLQRAAEPGRGYLIALIDGLTGLPDALRAVVPHTVIHHCVVPVRQSVKYVAWAERKAVCTALRAICQAHSDAAARDALTQFAVRPLGQTHAPIVVRWERHWAHIAPAFADPMPIRRVLHTTNAIESWHLPLRKIRKTRGHFPTNDAASTLRYLALRNLGKQWTERPDKHGRAAFSHLTLLFGDR